MLTGAHHINATIGECPIASRSMELAPCNYFQFSSVRVPVLAMSTQSIEGETRGNRRSSKTPTLIPLGTQQCEPGGGLSADSAPMLKLTPLSHIPQAPRLSLLIIVRLSARQTALRVETYFLLGIGCFSRVIAALYLSFPRLRQPSRSRIGHTTCKSNTAGNCNL